MNVRVITLLADGTTGRFDDEPLRAFQEANEVTHVTDHFYFHDGQPAMALLVTFRPRAEAAAYDRERPGRTADAGPVLTAEERVIYQALRKWRTDRAKRDGVPHYTVLPNRTFEVMARTRPATKAALSEVPGIGEARLALYGDELLALVAAIPSGASPSTDRDPPGRGPLRLGAPKAAAARRNRPSPRATPIAAPHRPRAASDRLGELRAPHARPRRGGANARRLAASSTWRHAHP